MWLACLVHLLARTFSSSKSLDAAWSRCSAAASQPCRPLHPEKKIDPQFSETVFSAQVKLSRYTLPLLGSAAAAAATRCHSSEIFHSPSLVGPSAWSLGYELARYAATAFAIEITSTLQPLQLFRRHSILSLLSSRPSAASHIFSCSSIVRSTDRACSLPSHHQPHTPYTHTLALS